jgi:esterase/lipase superfamily enzyme
MWRNPLLNLPETLGKGMPLQHNRTLPWSQERLKAGVPEYLPVSSNPLAIIKMLNRFSPHRFMTFICIAWISGIAGCGLLGEPPGPSADVDRAPHQVKIFFATDREADANNNAYYGANRAPMSYGITDVGIPPGHVMGRQEEPSLWKLESSSDASKHITVHDVVTLNRDDFLQRLTAAVEASPGGRLMIFLPGYNTEFLESNRVVAQFANDLKFTGPVLLFSWPSQGSLTGYTVDETNAEWAQADFVKLLTTLLETIKAQNIYVIGHSMGNRVIGRAMTTLAGDRPDGDLIVFREIVMIAPDIDADVFRLDIAPRLARTGIHVTVYASSNDRALMASKMFHGYPRAGETGDGLVVVSGVETIDASDVSGGLLGHSYFAEDRRIMEDIFALLQTGQRADQRFALKAEESGGLRYWTFRK